MVAPTIPKGCGELTERRYWVMSGDSGGSGGSAYSKGTLYKSDDSRFAEFRSFCGNQKGYGQWRLLCGSCLKRHGYLW